MRQLRRQARHSFTQAQTTVGAYVRVDRLRIGQEIRRPNCPPIRHPASRTLASEAGRTPGVWTADPPSDSLQRDGGLDGEQQEGKRLL